MLQLCCFLLCPDPGVSTGWAASLAFPGTISSLLISAQCGKPGWAEVAGAAAGACQAGLQRWGSVISHLWSVGSRMQLPAPAAHRAHGAPRAGFSCLNQPAQEQQTIPASPLLLLLHWLKITVVYTLDRFKHLSVKMQGISSLME